jgi:hypothetical protein
MNGGFMKKLLGIFMLFSFTVAQVQAMETPASNFGNDRDRVWFSDREAVRSHRQHWGSRLVLSLGLNYLFYKYGCQGSWTQYLGFGLALPLCNYVYNRFNGKLNQKNTSPGKEWVEARVLNRIGFISPISPVVLGTFFVLNIDKENIEQSYKKDRYQ